MYLPRNPVAPKTVTVCPKAHQSELNQGSVFLPPSEALKNDCQPTVFYKFLAKAATYRPPCILIIGFPVLVMETSSRIPLR